MTQNIYLHFLNLVPGIGAAKIKLLQKHFKEPKKVFGASYQELLQAGLNEKTAQNIILKKETVDLEKEIDFMTRNRIKIVSIADEKYPNLLKERKDAPALLYYRGELENECANNLAIVGTRKCSPYGKEVTEKLTEELCDHLNIVSGLAYGVDTIAHQRTVDRDKKGIAVFGSGLSCVQPSGNAFLAEEILTHGGALVSEYPPLFEARPEYFPMRNRIIAGLSKAVLITEAPKRSGALITAFLALDHDRDVFSVPGNITSKNSEGTNHLISLGAKPIFKASDVLEEFGILEKVQKNSKPDYQPQNENEKIILRVIKERQNVNIEEINRETSLRITLINQTLSLLELKGVIVSNGQGLIKIIN